MARKEEFMIMRSAILLSILCCGAVAGAVTQPAFFARRDYPSATGFVSVADINGDGIPDVISISGFTIKTLLGNENGAFRAGPTTTPGGQLIADVPIDLNGDGKIDLIMATASGLGVLLGNGDGTFQPPVFYAGGSGYLAVGDFNGDGIPDVVTDDSSVVWLYIGKGGGVFNPGVLTPFPSGSSGDFPVVAADFNGDGILDVATGLRLRRTVRLRRALWQRQWDVPIVGISSVRVGTGMDGHRRPQP